MNNVFKPIKYLSIIMLVIIISAVITYRAPLNTIFSLSFFGGSIFYSYYRITPHLCRKILFIFIVI